MGRFTTVTTQSLCSMAFVATSVLASPPTDDVTKAEGCIELSGGGQGVFALAASFDVGTGNVSGSVKYVDSKANFTVQSATLLDYSYLDPNVRGFIFQASGANYNEVRVFVSDWGSQGDQFQLQLLNNGTIVYDQFGTLSANCTGGGINGVVIGSNYCPPCPDPKNPNEPPKPPKKDKPPKGVKVKGNNGVGNGIDPQPPGNPPINDGPGTGPGNPGNRGGATKNKQK